MVKQINRIFSIAGVSLAAIISTAALANPRPGYEEAYGMAGCGLGSIAAKEFSWDNGFVQISASTTNGTYGNQTISMTIGISNCDDGLLTQQLNAEQEVFVGANLAQLSKDVARGEGEYVSAFADLLGCSEDSDTGSETSPMGSPTAKFIALGRAAHSEIFSTEIPAEVLMRYKNVIAINQLQCSRT